LLRDTNPFGSADDNDDGDVDDSINGFDAPILLLPSDNEDAACTALSNDVTNPSATKLAADTLSPLRLLAGNDVDDDDDEAIAVPLALAPALARVDNDARNWTNNGENVGNRE
jgi:hypothetical protein